MTLETRLTKLFDIKWPIISAPMAYVSGGKLAAAVNRGGGLGLIGGGYGEDAFVDQAWSDADGARTGIGFITWSLAKNPTLLEKAISQQPAAVFLSFGSPQPFAQKITDANIPMICQCQTLDHVREAVDHGASVIVAQGTEAGGHCGERSTMPFVPETADLLGTLSPATLLLAAGGIADGRGLAACLALGADGALIGTRYWASRQALVHEKLHQAGLDLNGDSTLRTRVPDIARNKNWPPGFKIRVARNQLMDDFHKFADDLNDEKHQELIRRYSLAVDKGDCNEAGIIIGEGIGMVSDLPDAEELTERIGMQAVNILKHLAN